MKRKSNFLRKEPRVAPWLFSHSWEQRKVSEIGTFSKGTGYSKSDIRDKGTPLILYGRLYTKYETVIREVDTFTTPKDGSVYSRGGEVIVPASGETAEDISIASVVEKAGVILGGDLNIITPQSGIDSAFLALSISHGEAHRSLSKLAQGKSVVHIHNSDIQTVEVGIPVQAEQESISQFFEKVDRLITLHQRVQCVTDLLISWEFDRFTIFWEQRKLGELCSLITKGTTPLDKSNTGNINFVKIENIDSISGEINITHRISQREHDTYLRRSQLKENDILFSIAGTLGRVTSVKSDLLPANTNQALAIVRLKEGNLSYIETYLKGKAVSEFVRKNPTIGAQPNLSLEQVGQLDVSIPSEQEQLHIGAFFRAIDTLITLHQRKPKVLTSHQNQANKIFFAFLCDESRIRRTNSWEQRKAKDLCFISTGKSNTQDSIEDGTYPFYVRSPIVEKSNRYLFDEEAVLTVGDGVGTGKVFHYVNGKYDLHQRVYRMFGFTDDISAKFFYYFFSTHFYDRVMSMTAKTSVDSVRLEMIADMDIQYPKVREQKAISDFFDGLNYLITLHQREFSHTKLNINYVKYYQRIRPLLYILCSVDKSV